MIMTMMNGKMRMITKEVEGDDYCYDYDDDEDD